ncbi:subtilisin-like protein, partial [Ascoidea rubescens DSM 1968]
SLLNQQSYNPHKLTGVDVLHQRGITGQNITIAIIDTGINYNLPSLGGGIGPGFKVEFGRNYVEGALDPNDPIDCEGHGTFISSVIAGQTKDFVGVAPNAKLRVYKVSDCNNQASTQTIIKALTDAANDNPDIISLSLGSYDGFSDSPISLLASNIAQSIPIVLSAGNSGDLGNFYSTAFASNKDIISVGSTNPIQYISWPAKLISSNNQVLDFNYFSKNDTQLNLSGTFPIYYSSQNICNLNLNQFSFQNSFIFSNLNDLSLDPNNINCNLNNLQDKFIFLSSQNPQYYNFSQNPFSLPSSSNVITFHDSVNSWIQKQLSLGNSISLKLSSSDKMTPFPLQSLGAGKMSSFSSWGPTFQNDFYPIISAPGADIFGQNLYNLESRNGTSLSAPYITGVIALYKSLYPNSSPQTIRNKLISTASTLSLFNEFGKSDSNLNAPLNQQGSGLVNAINFVDYSTSILSDPLLVLNDTDHRISNHIITIYNGGCEDVTYLVSHESAATVKARDENWIPSSYFPDYDYSQAIINYSKTCFTLKPGELTDITVDISPPITYSFSDGYLFSGKIVITGSNDEILKIPYMGVELSTNDWSGLEAYCIADNNGTLIDLSENDRIFDIQNRDTFSIYYRILYGSPKFAFDLVSNDYTLQDFTYPPSDNPKWISSLELFDGLSNYSIFSQSSPSRFNDFVYGDVSGLNNIPNFPAGKYQILLRSLKAFGNQDNINDWDLFL